MIIVNKRGGGLMLKTNTKLSGTARDILCFGSFALSVGINVKNPAKT